MPETVLIIAHRRRTVPGSDKIVVLDWGKVVQQGNPEKLFKEDGVYKRMISVRKKSAEWTLG